ncbi:hypothetical protein KSP39_PZI020493 [Platanthera zijinensis]|uniref:beta-glucosidase n=1 Tax=Platanthera zijinensis TaxID=2320716 RepID=A0AAP0AZS0_9ASPA
MGCNELRTILVLTLIIMVPFEYNQFTQEPCRPCSLQNCLYEQNRRCREEDPTTELQFMMSLNQRWILQQMSVFSDNPDSNFVKEGNFSYAIVVVKETPYAEMHGNRVNLTIPEPGPNSVRSVREAVTCGDCRCPVWIL